MKKLLTTTFCLSMLLMGTQVMAEEATQYSKQNTPQISSQEKRIPPQFKKGKHHRPPKLNLEEELNLTEAQKAQAKANRIEGRKEMKPIMDEIRNKKEAILDIIDSNLSKAEQKIQIEKIQKEIKQLYQKANTIREKNMAKFEKILTKEQKAKFEQIKKERFPQKQCKNCAKKMQPQPIPQD